MLLISDISGYVELFLIATLMVMLIATSRRKTKGALYELLSDIGGRISTGINLLPVFHSKQGDYFIKVHYAIFSGPTYSATILDVENPEKTNLRFIIKNRKSPQHFLYYRIKRNKARNLIF